MNWVGGGLQRHLKGNNSVIKQQKAHFAKARNSKRALAYTSPHGRVVSRNAASRHGERPTKRRKLDVATSDHESQLPQAFDQSQNSSENSFETEKQRLLAAEDWMGIGDIVNGVHASTDDTKIAPPLPRHRREVERKGPDRRSKDVIRSHHAIAIPRSEEVSVRIGFDALTSPIGKAPSAERRTDQSLDICEDDVGGRGDQDSDYRSDRKTPACSGSAVRSRHGNISTVSSDEILFDEPWLEDAGERLEDARIISMDSQLKHIEARVPKIEMPEPGLEEAEQTRAVGLANGQEYRTLEAITGAAGAEAEQILHHSPAEQRPPPQSLNSAWMRFIFGSSPPRTARSSASATSRLSLAARVSSSSASPERPRGRADMDSLSMAVHLGGGRTRDIVSISSRASSAVDDEEESDSEDAQQRA